MDIVTSLRTAALALIVALIGGTIAPAFAAERSRACGPMAMSAHSCCKTPVLKACCSDQSERSNDRAPAQSRVQVNPNFTVAPAMFVIDVASAVRGIAADQAAPRAGPVDLPTLLSTLLL